MIALFTLALVCGLVPLLTNAASHESPIAFRSHDKGYDKVDNKKEYGTKGYGVGYGGGAGGGGGYGYTPPSYHYSPPPYYYSPPPYYQPKAYYPTPAYYAAPSAHYGYEPTYAPVYGHEYAPAPVYYKPHYGGYPQPKAYGY